MRYDDSDLDSPQARGYENMEKPFAEPALQTDLGAGGSGVTWRVALDRDLVIVVGRSGFQSYAENERCASRFVSAVAAGLAD